MVEESVPRKWEFITEWCQKYGYDKLADIAYEIDQLLIQLYAETITDEWSEEYNLGNIDYLLYTNDKNELFTTVVNRSDYCVACENSYDGCNDCLFRQAGGVRSYYKFISLLCGFKVK